MVERYSKSIHISVDKDGQTRFDGLKKGLS
jgi:hypothetical protein